MKWLVWREYRLNQLGLAVGLALLIVPYMVALATLLWAKVPPSPDKAFAVAALYAVVLIQLTPALLGGNAIAGERADCSAQFIAYLPVSRVRRLTSKLSLTLATMVVLWGVNLLVMLLVLGAGFVVDPSGRQYGPKSAVLFRDHGYGVLRCQLADIVATVKSDLCGRRRPDYPAGNHHGPAGSSLGYRLAPL